MLKERGRVKRKYLNGLERKKKVSIITNERV
jgi:hypothetical protein